MSKNLPIPQWSPQSYRKSSDIVSIITDGLLPYLVGQYPKEEEGTQMLFLRLIPALAQIAYDLKCEIPHEDSETSFEDLIDERWGNCILSGYSTDEMLCDYLHDFFRVCNLVSDSAE
jgi:hypothetical protein